MGRSNKKHPLIFFIILFIIIVVLAIFSAKDRKNVNFIDNAVNVVVKPVSKAFTSTARFFEDFSDNLEQAGVAALAGNWADATQKAAKSRAQWEKYRHFWSAFTDHEPVEQMQELFSRLEIYRQKQLEVDFAAVCSSLVQMAEAIDESHSLKWWSVL